LDWKQILPKLTPQQSESGCLGLKGIATVIVLITISIPICILVGFSIDWTIDVYVFYLNSPYFYKAAYLFYWFSFKSAN